MPPVLQLLLARMHAMLGALDADTRDERGLTTAELLGNAALGVLALVAIWGAMRTLGLDIVDWIRTQLISQ
jgi:hypothetical protein